MAEGFVPLARTLRAHAPGPRADATAVANTAPAAARPEANAGCAEPPPSPPSELASLALLRLAALEAFDRGAARLLAGLAHDVLGRELRLAPVDVEALVARARSAFAASGPVAIEVGPADASAVAAVSGLPVRIDPALGPGDVVVRVRDGAFESPFAFRLARVLAEAGAS